MDINIFPAVFNDEEDDRTKKALENEEKRHNEKMNSFPDNIDDTSKSRTHFFLFWWDWLLIIGLGVVVAEGLSLLGVEGEICTVFFFMVAIGMLFFRLYKNYKYSKESADTAYNYRAQARQERDEEVQRHEKAMQQIRNNSANNKNRYQEEFEKKVVECSTKFADSELVDEVASWLTSFFDNFVQNADRSEHIESITLAFPFNVYSNKISCDFGSFDFQQHNCRSLNGADEQAGLAKAIATKVQLNMIINSSTDPSGSAVQYDIDYRYTERAAVATITYATPNGFYREARKW